MKHSSIQWCHSSLNLQMGCDGCELWNGSKRICYAGTQTVNRAGNPGWPDKFEEPKLFLDRLPPALKWKPPTEAEQESKPWIPRDMPRLIFLNDMGDTFSAKLPLDWMAPMLSAIGASAHQFLLLTKRPSRLVEFSQHQPLPRNLWPGTSVTSDKTAKRVEQLVKVNGGGPRFVSFEPMWSEMPEACFGGIQWAIFGGQSGKDAVPCHVAWIHAGIRSCRSRGIAPFVKQLGSAPSQETVYTPSDSKEQETVTKFFRFKDSHGGDWSEWPEELQVREFPML